MLYSNFSLPASCHKNISLDVYLKIDAEPAPLVIFVHGFKGFKDWGTHSLVAEYFVKQGLNFSKFNFSHNGISSEAGDKFDDLEGFANNTFSKEISELDQVVNFAGSGNNFPKPTEMFLIGHSLGGGISIIHTSENKSISKLVTWASINSFRNLWTPEQEDNWRKEGVLYFLNSRTQQQLPINSTLLDDLTYNAGRLDILSAAANIDRPWLIIHGEEDTGVPPTSAFKLWEQQPSQQLLLIPNADHVFNAKHPWMENTLPHELKVACDATIAFFKTASDSA